MVNNPKLYPLMPSAGDKKVEYIKMCIRDRIYTVTTRIVDYVYIGSQEGLTDATNLAVFLMAIALIVLYVSNFVVGKREYITVSGKSTRPNIVDLGKWRIPITVVVSLFAIVVVAIPFATVFMTSFTTVSYTHLDVYKRQPSEYRRKG